ncbi:MAG TPA: peptidylprolyl isomerase [bacterium]
MPMLIALLSIVFGALADQVAAIVGDDVILESEVAANSAYIASDPAAKTMFGTDEEIRTYVLNELIASRLMVVQAEVESIGISNDELQSRVKTIIENIKQNFPSEADFYKWLAERGITLEEIKKNAEESQRTKMLMQELIMKKWGTKIMISPIAVRRFYDQNKDSIAFMPGRIKLAHILLVIRPGEDALKKQFDRAIEVYKLILAGGDFSVIAQEFSEDENSKRQGGMLGRIKKGETLEEFEKVIFSLKPGVVSQPFPTRLGYHIVEVLNKGPDWVLARQILLTVETTKADTIRVANLARRIKEQIEQGANFDSLAKINSMDPNVDLGDFYVNQLTPPFDEVVKDLAQGQVSEPILTPYGYHLLYAREKTPEKHLEFDELRERIYQYLYEQELQKHYDRLIEELKQKTYVKIFPLQ